MATETKNPLIQKAAIRTMKKDLQRLREADILAESEKIMSAKTAPAAQKPAIFTPSQAVSVPKNDLSVASQKKDIPKEQIINRSVVEKYASEEEKQRLFALKSQKETAEQQVQKISKEKKPEILAKKTKLEGIKNLWKKKLTPLQEKSSEGKQKWSEEKKEWKAEKEIAEKEKEIAKSQMDYEKISAEEVKIKEDARKAEDALKQIYSNVTARKEEKEKSQPQSNAGSHVPTLSASGHPSATPPKTEEIAVKKPTFEEKMAKAATEEDKIRIKFMEDVEKWASSQ